ncbi:MAG: mevalonate kinase [Kiritimatiellia bacterium]|jgi:glucuronokinase
MIIRTKAYPRAALIGNPSDGYFGKTIAFTFREFAAEVQLYETPELEILPTHRDESTFPCIQALAEDVRLFGYYGGIRLLKSAIKCFYHYCLEHGIALHDRNFTIQYDSTIPGLVGLAGSSAIITACMRALMAFYDVDIPLPRLANLIRDVESRELGISAGLQDRVAQVYQGLVYMDFDKATMDRQGYGTYERLDPALLPPVYIAYRTDLSEGSEVFHNTIRVRFDSGDPVVTGAMREWADLTVQARRCLERNEPHKLAALMDRNFDLRASLYRLSEGNLRMVRTARSVGASAKFSGSGGAIVGTFTDDAMFDRLARALAEQQVKVFRPTLV